MLKQSFALTNKVVSNKIPFSIIITFTTLLLVYTSYYTVNGVSDFLNSELVTPWLKDRTHFIFSVDSCDSQVTMQTLTAVLQQSGYESISLCSKVSDVTVFRKSKFPDEPRISRVLAVEYQPKYLQLIQLKTSYQEDIKAWGGECLKEIGDVLLEGKSFSEKRSTQCNLNDDALPVISIGQGVAHSLSNGPGRISAGMTIHLYERVSLDNLSDTSGKAFVIASVFETGFDDLDHTIIGPKDFLSDIVSPSQQKYKIQLKVKEVSSLDDLRGIHAFIQENENLSNRLEYSVINDEIWELQNLALDTTAAITWVVHVLVYFVLLSGLSQFIEANRKLLALMRISGIKVTSIWLFLFIITLISVALICVFSYFLSFLVSEGLVHHFEHIDYLIDWKVLINTLIKSVFIAIGITIALKIMHFSGDLSQELEYARRNS
jgi:hypothetical protein